MRKMSRVRSVALAMVVLFAAGGFVVAQDKDTSPAKPTPAEAGADPSMAKPEGSSTPALNAPDRPNPESTVGLAPPDQPINNAKPNVAGQVVPSTHETAAFNQSIFEHDQQPTLSHTFNFTNQQRQAVVDAVTRDDQDSGSAKAPFEIAKGVVLPRTVKLQPIPDSVLAEMPWVKPYRYVKFGDKIVLVDANLHYVAAIIE